MNCHRLLGKCECGGFAQPISLWITDQKALLVTCFCIQCEKQINIVFPLNELYKCCPKPTISAKKLDEMVSKEISRIVRPPLAEKLTVEDAKWMVEMHIMPPEGGTLS